MGEVARVSATAVKVWTCQRMRMGSKCGHRNPSRKRNCQSCGKPRPPRREPAHRKVLVEMPYEQWVERFGDRCNICGAEAKTRRLHRDHDHRTGQARGVLCFRCNAALRSYMTAEWLASAAAYLERSLELRPFGVEDIGSP